MSSFDVWVVAFGPGRGSPAERLQGAFGIDETSARSLEQSLPKIVKHAVPAKAAGEMRQALESIGAIVECRPARPKPAAATEGTAVFRAPDADLVAGRTSAIDPFAPTTDASVPRISVDEPAPPELAVPVPAPVTTTSVPPANTAPRGVAFSLLATSRERQRNRFAKRAAGMVVAGLAILAIGWFFGSSVLRGDAGPVQIAFDGLGIYFIGVGVFDFVTTVRG